MDLIICILFNGFGNQGLFVAINILECFINLIVVKWNCELKLT